jgi:hypothetical protein
MVVGVVGSSCDLFNDSGDVSKMSALAETFMKVMNDQPLSLALCVMNLLLLWYCFRLTGSFTKARSETVTMIVDWQKQSQEIMANCVSKDVMEMVLASLERDRETYRAMLPTFQSKEAVGSPIESDR